MFLKALAKYTPRLLSDLGGLSRERLRDTPLANSAMATISALRPEDLEMFSHQMKHSRSVFWEVWGVRILIQRADLDVDHAVIQTGVFLGTIGGLSFDDARLVAAMADVRAKYAAWQARLAEQRAEEAQAELERIAAEERALEYSTRSRCARPPMPRSAWKPSSIT